MAGLGRTRKGDQGAEEIRYIARTTKVGGRVFASLVALCSTFPPFHHYVGRDIACEMSTVSTALKRIDGCVIR